MKEILITSSALIASLLVIRFLFRKAVSHRVLYALWVLVLLRLLVPVNLPAIPLSVLNAGKEAQAAITQFMGACVQPAGQTPAAGLKLTEQAATTKDVRESERPGNTARPETGQPADGNAGWLPVGDVLTYVWITGIAVTTCFFLVTNLRFRNKLRRNRTP